jgi:hypothetical protein
MSGKAPDQPPAHAGKPALEVHPEHRQAVDMLNSIRVLGPDLRINEDRTRAERRSQFAKIKHIMDDYDFCEETGKIVRIR